MPRIQVRVPATTANLGPGFDCLGFALDLWNVFDFDVCGRGLRISCEGEGTKDLPRNAKNLVYDALLRGLAGEPNCPVRNGLRIHSCINVPLSQGLGSSATAIVAGILAANTLRLSPLSPSQLLDLATEADGHPDNVAPALAGGLTINVLTGKKHVESIRIDMPEGLFVSIAVPEMNVSTRASRNSLPSNVPFKDAVFSLSRAALLVAALTRGDFNALRTATEDALHQPYRMGQVPGFKAAVGNALKAGALGAALSGSGPSVIAFTERHTAERVADAMISGFRSGGVAAKSLITRPSSQGARVLVDYHEPGGARP